MSSVSEAADQTHTTMAPRPTSERSRGTADRGVAVALAQPAAAKNTGIGASIADHANPGWRASTLSPRNPPSGPRSMTAIVR